MSVTMMGRTKGCSNCEKCMRFIHVAGTRPLTTQLSLVDYPCHTADKQDNYRQCSSCVSTNHIKCSSFIRFDVLCYSVQHVESSYSV